MILEKYAAIMQQKSNGHGGSKIDQKNKKEKKIRQTCQKGNNNNGYGRMNS